MVLREVVNPHGGRGKSPGRADAERSARAERIGDPADDRRANGRAAESDGEEDRDELAASGQRARKRVEEARDAVADRVVAVLDERDLADFDRIAKKVLAEFEGSAAPAPPAT
jgi:hypothetical protein